MVKRGNFGSVNTKDLSSSKQLFGEDKNGAPLHTESNKKSSYAINTIDDNTWKVIEEIINNPNLKWEETAYIQTDKNNGVGIEDTSVRDCKICFLNYDEELDKIFKRMVAEYNYKISSWGYDIKTLESIQLTHYSEGEFYDWHVDEFQTDLVKDDGEKSNRKISVTVWLNDPTEYGGGELDLEVRGPNCKDWEPRYDTLKLPKKSIVIFPSNTWHRVRPVTSGIRKSLVLWFQGPPFR